MQLGRFEIFVSDGEPATGIETSMEANHWLDS